MIGTLTRKRTSLLVTPLNFEMEWKLFLTHVYTCINSEQKRKVENTFKQFPDG